MSNTQVGDESSFIDDSFQFPGELLHGLDLLISMQSVWQWFVGIKRFFGVVPKRSDLVYYKGETVMYRYIVIEEYGKLYCS